MTANAIIDELNSQGESLITTQSQVRYQQFLSFLMSHRFIRIMSHRLILVVKLHHGMHLSSLDNDLI
jgi:hypothetical protein